ncbi:polyadenylate-binding protein-interacting protein 6 [Tanacetum coccineum]
MKTGTSLNPYATAYIPLSRRGAGDESKGFESTVVGTTAAWVGQNQYPEYSQNDDGLALPQNRDNVQHKNKSESVFGSSSQSAEIAGKDADYDMNLAYLQMSFPGISDESLSGVYAANGGDMEATLDMLDQLELYSGDSLENLPDSLDIGDVSEAGSSSVQKLKVSGEVTLAEALKGTTMNITTLDQRDLAISVSDIITPEYIVAVSHEGMPVSKDPGFRGDLKVHFEVKFPKTLTSEQKTALRLALDG